VLQSRPNLVVALGPRAAFGQVQRYLGRADLQITRLLGLDAKWAFLAEFHQVLSEKAAQGVHFEHIREI
jgi:hypothetical protein